LAPQVSQMAIDQAPYRSVAAASSNRQAVAAEAFRRAAIALTSGP
jgi:hypothetical protein